MLYSIVAASFRAVDVEAVGSTGIEGARDDDWMAVDCYNIIVHLMLPGSVHQKSC